MAIVQLPVQTSADETHRRFTKTLEDVRFVFDFYTDKTWWYMDLRDAFGNPTVLGIRVVGGNLDLLSQYRYLDVPPGILMCVSLTAGSFTDPTFSSFIDGTHAVWYVTSDDPLAEVS